MNKDNVWKVIRLIKTGELSLEASKSMLNEKEWNGLVKIMKIDYSVKTASPNWKIVNFEVVQ